MKKYIVSAVVLLVFAGVVFAEEREGRDEGRRKARAERAARPRQRLHKELDLTEDQQKQFRQIMQTQRQAVENWRKEHGEALRDLHKQMREAMKAGEKEKGESIREKMKKLFEGRKELHEGLAKRLGDVLTEEQLAKFKKSFSRRGDRGREGPGRHPIIRGLARLRAARLTPEQHGKVRKILDEAMKKITDDVLTAEQREKLKKLGQGGDRIRRDRGEGDRPRRGEGRRPRGGDPEGVEAVTPE